MIPTRLGPYPIEREVGRGGMGVVYLGRDIRLDRPVAIKVLPDGFAHDPERLARFEREARLLAALTHPNIAGIYGLDESEGKRFLALEYVEGETLAEHLRRGPLPIDETLDVCRQIATALEAAHEAGIVHRDLKPGNVKLTPAGEVKVLDFGLAKGSVGAADSALDLSQSPTMTQAATGVGVILGTAAYMSPEQARGKPVDRRTDIWSFGCVLYECLTGQQAFAGETVSDVIARILQGEPDAAKLPHQTPEKLRLLLARCLEKDARRRLRDIGDARIEIEELQGRHAPRTSGITRAPGMVGVSDMGARPGARWKGVAVGAALALAGAGAGIAAWTLSGAGHRDAAPVRFTITAPPHGDLDLDPNQIAISPDGNVLLFSVSDSSGQNSLWLRPLASFEAHVLDGTRGAVLPFWSPDGKQIGFFADGKLKRIRVAGGGPEVICDAPNGRGADWSASGVIVFAPNSGGPLFQVRASGGTPQPVTVVDTSAGETAHRWPRFLPDGEHFMYAALPTRKGEFACYVGSIGSKRRTPLLTAAGAPVYAPPGYLVFSRTDALLAQKFNAARGRLSGDPFTIGDPPAPTIFTASPRMSVSRTGVLAWTPAGRPEMRIYWVDRHGREIGTVDVPRERWGLAALSPDDRRAIVEQDLPSGDTDLWMVDLERGLANRLTYGQGKNTAATWARDGRSFYYSSTRGGVRDIYRRMVDGSGADERIYHSAAAFKDASDTSPDGRWIVIQENGATDGWNLLLLPSAGGTPTPYLVTPFNEQAGIISPDGRWMLYTSDESGSTQAYMQSFPVPGRKQQVSKNGAVFATWTGGGREVLVLQPDLTYATVPVLPGPEPSFGRPEVAVRFPPGARFVGPNAKGDRFLIIAPADEAPRAISVAVNWRAGHEAP